MKKLSTISLFIFAVIVIAVLVAGLVFYQSKKNNKVVDSSVGALAQDTIDQLKASGKSLILNMEEINKHNNPSDCWMLINGKVYNITSYFGSHPGGNSTMAATCGEDATAEYATKNPSSTSSSGGQSHSSGATSMLANYYIGDLNQTIGQQKITETNTVVAPTSVGEDEDEYEDD
jgi:cytochrome b involved in lipid metabolism